MRHRWNDPVIDGLPRCDVNVFAMVRYPLEDILVPEVVWRTVNTRDNITDRHGFVTKCIGAVVVKWMQTP